MLITVCYKKFNCKNLVTQKSFCNFAAVKQKPRTRSAMGCLPLGADA